MSFNVSSELQQARVNQRWKKAREKPDPQTEAPWSEVVHQLSLAKEEKLLDVLNQAWWMMAEAVRLMDLALELRAPHRYRVLMTATKVSERILTGLHEAARSAASATAE
jgi:hypothetical protein